jgi:hypothetical protein
MGVNNDNGMNTEGAPLGEQAKQGAQQAVQQGQQAAGKLVEQAKSQVRDQLASKKDQAAGTLEGVAQALQVAVDHLREQGHEGIGHYGERAAQQVTRMSSYLNEKNVDEVIGEVSELARRQPAVVLGAAVVLGVVAARFLKSSSGNSQSMTGSGSHAMIPYQGGESQLPAAPTQGLNTLSSSDVSPLASASGDIDIPPVASGSEEDQERSLDSMYGADEGELADNTVIMSNAEVRERDRKILDELEGADEIDAEAPIGSGGRSSDAAI